MKNLHVACALIERGGKVLATQRSETMSMPLKWEFPGGKIDPGETAEACLKRELREELGIEIGTGAALHPTTHQYAEFEVTLYPFLCTILSGVPALHEHTALAWLSSDELQTLDWAEADLPVLEEYCRLKSAV